MNKLRMFLQIRINFGIIILSLLFVFAMPQTYASSNSCQQFYGVDLRAQYWEKWVSYFEKHTSGKANPFQGLILNSDEIGRVHNRLRAQLTSYKYIFIDKLNKSSLDMRVFQALENKVGRELTEKFQKNIGTTFGSDAYFAGLYVTKWMKDKRAAIEADVAEKKRQEELKEQKAEKEKQDKEDKEKQQQQQDQQQQQQQDQQKQQDQQDQQDQQQKQDQKKKDKDKQQKKDEKKNPWEKKPEKEYKPHNKEMPDSSKDGEKLEALSTNAFLNPQSFLNYRLFAEKYFDDFNSQSLLENANIRPSTIQDQVGDSKYYTNLKTYGQDRITLPKQYGFEPIIGNHSGFSIRETQAGRFDVIFNSDVIPEAIKIPLISVTTIRHEEETRVRNNYLKKSGINQKLWPDHIQLGIEEARRVGGTDPLKIAAFIEKYISQQGPYMYYTKKGKDLSSEQIDKVDKLIATLSQSLPMPVAMAHAKVFNCDGSAWIGALLLRDVFDIPTRIVGGRTADGVTKEGNETLLAMSDSSIEHMWVEVLHQGKWHPFDMTPKKNEPQPDSASDKSKDKDNNKDDNKKPQDKKDGKPDGKDSQDDKAKDGEDGQGEKDGQDSRDSKDGKDSKDAKDGKKSSEGDSDSSSDSKSSSDSSNSSSAQKDQKGQPDKKEGERKFVDQSREDESGISADSEKYLQKIVSAEIERFAHTDVLLSDKKEKSLKEILKFVEEIQRGALRSTMEELSQKISYDTKLTLALGDQTIVESLREIQNNLLGGKQEVAYYKAYAIFKALRGIAGTRPLNKEESKLADDINRLLIYLRSIRHESSEQHELVNRVMDSLPGPVSKSILRSNYGEEIQSLGSVSQAAIANDIKNGNLGEFVRMGLLADYVDLFLNSDKIPSYHEEKVFFRSVEPKPTSDLVIARSPLEYARMLFNPDPGEHLFAKLFRGEQFAMGPRETIIAPNPMNPIERKISILFYDVSPSMKERDKYIIQQSLVKGFVDSAAKDRDHFGNPLHEVIVIPFDTQVLAHLKKEVKTYEDVKRLINSNLVAPKNQGGTEIQPALLYFYDLVEKAISSIGAGDRRFARANLVLMSDGGATVNLEPLIARQKGLGEVKTTFNFVAVGETNEQLVQLTKDANSIVGPSFYHHVNYPIVQRVMKESENPKFNSDAFATKVRAPDRQTMEIMDSLISQLGKLGDDLDIRALYDLKDKVKQSEKPININISRLKIIEFQQMAEVLKYSDLIPKDLRLKIVYRLLQVYPRYIGRNLDELTITESDIFESLFDWAKI